MGSFQVARNEDMTMLTLPNLETASKSKKAKVLAKVADKKKW